MPRSLRDLGAMEILYRDYEVLDIQARERRDGAADDDPVEYEICISTEAEVERWFGIEILSHERNAIDLSRAKRGLQFLFNHNSSQVAGLVRDVRVDDDKKLRGVVTFSISQLGRDIEADYKRKLRPYISVGYFIKKAKLADMREVGKDQDGNPIRIEVWKITRWQPAEASTVSVPADVDAGEGRAVRNGSAKSPFEIEEEEDAMLRGSRLFDQAGGGGGGAAVADPANPNPAPAGARAIITEGDIQTRVDAAVAAANERASVIHSLADAWGIPAGRAQQWVTEGKTVREVQALLAEEKKTRGEVSGAARSLQDMGANERDLREYRYSNAILGAALMAEGRQWIGLERDVHDALEKQRPEKFQNGGDRGGVLAPLRLRNSGLEGDPAKLEAAEMRGAGLTGMALRQALAMRALDSKTLGKGSEFVYEQAGELIELLRNYAAVLSMGARSLTGLTQPISFPKQTGASTAYWVGENPPSDVPESDITLGLVLMSMKTIQASTAWSRQLLLTGSVDVEAMVREDIAIQHALLIDYAALHGLGANGEPTGLYKAADVSISTIGGAMSYAKLLEMQGKVAGANAYRGKLGLMVHTTMATNLRGILDFPASAAGRPIWGGTYEDGTVAGYRAAATNQVSNTMTGSERTGGTEIGAAFGNWMDMIVGGYGALEFIIDPLRLKKRAMIECTSFQGVDVLIRRGQSFCKATGATG